jgi:hypothetical protein
MRHRQEYRQIEGERDRGRDRSRERQIEGESFEEDIFKAARRFRV